MKLTAGILILLITINGCFYFNTLLLFSKKEAKEIIKKGNENLALIKISIKASNKTDENEIWYNNQLYDVAKKIIVHDSIYEYLYHDKHEQDIISVINSIFRINDDNVFTSLPGSLNLKNIHAISYQQYIFWPRTSSSNYYLKTSPAVADNKIYIPSNCFEVLIPPPKITRTFPI